MRSDIQPVFVTVEGREMVVFMDPLRMADEGFAVDRRALSVLAMMDGTRDLLDIQAELMRVSGGSIVPMEHIEAFLERLDEALLLDSRRFRDRRRAVEEEFLRAGIRRTILDGRSYEADPEALAASIEELERSLPPLPAGTKDGISGVVAPHIDLKVAFRTYVDVYRRLRDASFDTVVVLGVNHYGSDGLYCLTEKDFETPFGVLKTHREIVRRLSRGMPPGGVAPTDLDHKSEHSIEFQALFIAYYLGVSRTRIVPVLCGSFHEFVRSGRDPAEDPRFIAFRDALCEVVSADPGRVLVVAGVDFSHVGLKFGHDQRADRLLDKAMEHDRALLGCLMEGDASGLFGRAASCRDAYNVCGLPALVLMSSVLGKRGCELVAHEVYDERVTGSAVTYAALAFSGARDTAQRVGESG